MISPLSKRMLNHNSLKANCHLKANNKIRPASKDRSYHIYILLNPIKAY